MVTLGEWGISGEGICELPLVSAGHLSVFYLSIVTDMQPSGMHTFLLEY